MKSKMVVYGFLLALNLFASSSICFANGFKAMAKELSSAAKNSSIERVAVLSFVPVDGGSSKGGWNISEKLITQIVRIGKVQAVERSLLHNLMDEHHLAQTGMVDASTLKKLGKVFSADGVIAGSFTNLGRKAVINARLINVETGVIIAAVEREVDREWFETSFSVDSGMRLASLWVPAPEFTVEAPPLPSDNFSQLYDAPADNTCAGAAERVDRLENQILDIKARYWATRLKKGFSMASIKVNPGSTITDPILKKSFYDRLKYWYGLENIPKLTPTEVQRFVAIDGKAYSLFRECGV